MKKKNMVDYLGSITELDKDNFEKMIKNYGEENVCQFLSGIIDSISNSDSITKKDKKELLKKFDYFINEYSHKKEQQESNHETKELSDDEMEPTNFELEMEDETENINENYDILDENLYDTDIFKAYLNEINKYPLLTEEEEALIAKDLLLIKEINIITTKQINKNEEPVIDLEKVFLSITTKEEQEYILKLLYNYYATNKKQESLGNKMITYYLNEYQKLCKQIEIPQAEDLNNYFSKNKLYMTFTKFDPQNKLSPSEIIKQVELYTKYMIARDKMINHNQRLIVFVAKTYSNNRVELLDNISEGNIGLIKAIEKFDVNKGYKFSTYAIWWIKQNIARAIYDKSGIIRLPVHVQENLSKIKRAIKKSLTDNNKIPTNEEISQITKIPVEEIENLQLIGLNYNPVSLEKPVGDDEDSILGEFIPNEDEDIESTYIEKDLKEQIASILSTIPAREAEVIKYRFGLGEDDQRKTLEKVGKKYHVTRERVRQIENKAIRRLRYNSQMRSLRDYLNK